MKRAGLWMNLWLWTAFCSLAFAATVATGADAEKQEAIDAMYAKYQRKFPDVQGITAAELLAAMEAGKDLVVVDVREPVEQAVSMIPGAITREQFESERDSLRGRRVITYCTAGYRSGQYAEKLLGAGWSVRNLQGSLLSWTHVGGPLVDRQGPTKRVHVYSGNWNLVATGYQPVW